MTEHEAWLNISSRLSKLRRIQATINQDLGFTNDDIKAEAIAFSALQEQVKMDGEKE